MNKADNDAGTRAIDSLINYVVTPVMYPIQLLLHFSLLYLAAMVFMLTSAKAMFHLQILLSDFVLFYKTVKYFNNETYEADKYDEYLKSKLYILSFVLIHFILKYLS